MQSARKGSVAGRLRRLTFLGPLVFVLAGVLTWLPASNCLAAGPSSAPDGPPPLITSDAVILGLLMMILGFAALAAIGIFQTPESAPGPAAMAGAPPLEVLGLIAPAAVLFSGPLAR